MPLGGAFVWKFRRSLANGAISVEKLDFPRHGQIPESHCLVLLIGAGRIDGSVWFSVVFLEISVCQHPFFDFFAADICEHVAVDFDAGGERLAAALFHFPAKRRIFDDVLFLIIEAVFAHDGAHAFAPATESFKVSGDFRG